MPPAAALSSLRTRYNWGKEDWKGTVAEMAVWKKLPMGIEQFEEIRRDGYYYVDKTGLIRVLMENGGKANLFTRPRRFGKSLNMSMLRSFFEIGCDGKLFDGLEIAGEKELCEKYMGKYPVISISLKGVEAENWEEARDRPSVPVAAGTT